MTSGGRTAKTWLAPGAVHVYQQAQAVGLLAEGVDLVVGVAEPGLGALGEGDDLGLCPVQMTAWQTSSMACGAATLAPVPLRTG
ncbi:hypothetical protein [Streptomyces sp. NPDC056188]|uniref:hypothetical protein n=1 Tax=unclassified Streptomyces TaxID=2593676 RepID=UPI0026D5A59C